MRTSGEFASASRRAPRLSLWIFSAMLIAALPSLGRLEAQVLEFESGGLTYQAQTRAGLTVMFAPLPTRVLGYSILQVAVSNGSTEDWIVRPEDFAFDPTDGVRVQAISADAVVGDVFNRAGRGDVGRLIAMYESALYGHSQFISTNGYENRRRDAMGVGNTRMRAAAAASAVVMAPTVLAPGQSIDGAVFFPTQNRPMGAGLLRMIAMRPAQGRGNDEDPLKGPLGQGVAFEYQLMAPAPASGR